MQVGRNAINVEVNRIVQAYDHNKNGQIDLPGAATAPFGLDESVRKPGGLGNLTYRWTMIDLFRNADANQDNVVTRDELRTELATFDQNGDGALQWQRTFAGRFLDEYGKFLTTEGERAINRRGERI